MIHSVERTLEIRMAIFDRETYRRIFLDWGS
jgi:hypothetical protein